MPTPHVILLGAGASVDADIPMATNLTREMIRQSEKSGRQDIMQALYFVLGNLLSNRGNSGENPLLGVDVESLFNAFDFLATRSTSEVASFVGSWHPKINELESEGYHSLSYEFDKATAASAAGHLLQALTQSNYPYGNSLSFPNYGGTTSNLSAPLAQAWGPLQSQQLIDALNRIRDQSGVYSSNPFDGVCSSLVDLVARRGSSTSPGIFVNAGAFLVEQLKTWMWLDPTTDTHIRRVDYLRPLLDYAATNSDVFLVSLNYDNTIEYLAHHSSLKVDTGLTKWSATSRFEFEASFIPLLKLHGSIDWKEKGGMITSGPPEGRPVVIFGGKNKLTTEGPFLDMLLTFRDTLSKAVKLSVVGYSFRDVHINSYLRAWVKADANRSIAILDPTNRTTGSYQPMFPPKQVRWVGKTAKEGLDAFLR